ncbi:MAG: OmpA family protein, partial [Myxococcota bacterium]
IPLGISLRQIAHEARITRETRDILESDLRDSARLGELTIRFTRESIKVDAVVLTKSYDAKAERRLQAVLSQVIERPVTLDLDQVLVDQGKSLDPSEFLRMAETSLTAPLQAQIAQLTRRYEQVEDFRAAAPFRVGALDVDVQSRQAVLYAGPSKHLNAASYREIEDELSRRYPTWQLRVIPPPQPLVPIPFELGSSELTPSAQEALDTVVWTLQRWGARRVTATGYASSAGPKRLNRALALARADAVAEHLRTHAIDVATAGEFRQTGQDTIEKLFGLSRYHRVDVILRHNEDPATPTSQPSIRRAAEVQRATTTTVGAAKVQTSQPRSTASSTTGH